MFSPHYIYSFASFMHATSSLSELLIIFRGPGRPRAGRARPLLRCRLRTQRTQEVVSEEGGLEASMFVGNATALPADDANKVFAMAAVVSCRVLQEAPASTGPHLELEFVMHQSVKFGNHCEQPQGALDAKLRKACIRRSKLLQTVAEVPCAAGWQPQGMAEDALRKSQAAIDPTQHQVQDLLKRRINSDTKFCCTEHPKPLQDDDSVRALAPKIGELRSLGIVEFLPAERPHSRDVQVRGRAKQHQVPPCPCHPRFKSVTASVVVETTQGGEQHKTRCREVAAHACAIIEKTFSLLYITPTYAGAWASALYKIIW